MRGEIKRRVDCGDDGLRINDLTQVFIGAGAKLSDPPSANSAPPRFNHHCLSPLLRIQFPTHCEAIWNE